MKRWTLVAAQTLASALASQGYAGQPPALTRHPLSQRVRAGHTLRLFGGTSDPLASYSWEKDGSPIPEQLTPGLVLRHTLPNDSGQFSLVARNTESVPGHPEIGESASRKSTVTVVVPPAMPGALDLDFGDAALNGGEVRRIEALPDGGALVVGTFESASGRPAGGWLKLRPDGTPDPGFATTPGAQGGRVRALARHRDGWVIGGDFTHIHGVSAPRLARLTSTGAYDPSFRPPALASTVRTVATQEIGGELRVLVGLSAAPWLVRLRADGSLDAPFASQVAAAGLNGRVGALALQTDGRIVMGGLFFQDARWPFRRVGRLLASGVPDTTGFRHGAGTGADGEVLAVGIDALGRIHAGGSFSTMHGQEARFYTRLTAAGEIDPEFRARPDDSVLALTVLDDSSVVIAGLFTRVAGQSRPSVARLGSTGAPDPAWQPLAVDGFANAVAMGAGGRLLVGGDFTQPHRGLVALRSQPHSGPPAFLAVPTRTQWTEGHGGVLSVAAQAAAEAVYSWYRLGDSKPFLQTATGEWSVPAVSAQHAGQYEVEISTPLGSVRSPAFEVAVRARAPGERPHWRGLPDAALGPVPDQGERLTSIPLPEVTVEEVHVTVSLTHRDINDLVIELRSPTGRVVRLLDPEEPTAMRGGQDLDLTVFADAADTLINDAPAPCIGTYRPSADPPALASLRGRHPRGNWQISVVDTRDDGAIADLRLMAIDVFGPHPTLDSTTLSAVIPPGDEPVLAMNPHSQQARYRHWQPAGSPSPNYEWAPDLGSWQRLPSSAQRRQRREDDQTAAVWLGLPNPGPSFRGFLRARWP